MTHPGRLPSCCCHSAAAAATLLLLLPLCCCCYQPMPSGMAQSLSRSALQTALDATTSMGFINSKICGGCQGGLADTCISAGSGWDVRVSCEHAPWSSIQL